MKELYLYLFISFIVFTVFIFSIYIDFYKKDVINYSYKEVLSKGYMVCTYQERNS